MGGRGGGGGSEGGENRTEQNKRGEERRGERIDKKKKKEKKKRRRQRGEEDKEEEEEEKTSRGGGGGEKDKDDAVLDRHGFAKTRVFRGLGLAATCRQIRLQTTRRETRGRGEKAGVSGENDRGSCNSFFYAARRVMCYDCQSIASSLYPLSSSIRYAPPPPFMSPLYVPPLCPPPHHPHLEHPGPATHASIPGIHTITFVSASTYAPFSSSSGTIAPVSV